MALNKIQIYATPRSGSNYLHYVLTGYTGYYWKGSPFNYRESKNLTEDEIDQNVELILCQMEELDDFVCKTHPAWFTHQLFDHMPDQRRRMLDMIDHTIVLTRKDIVSATISMALAAMKSEWVQPYTENPISVDIDDFLNIYCRGMYLHYVSLVENKSNVAAHQVLFYEDIDTVPRITFAKLDMCVVSKDNLKGLPTTIKKTPPKRDIITNYDELYDAAVTYFDEQRHDAIQIENGIITDINLERLWNTQK